MARSYVVPLGLLASASDPTGHNAGDLYFNTTSGTVKIYTGSVWEDANTTVIDGGTP
jgi:hypothetical protein